MAFLRTLFILLVISMAISPLFAQASRLCLSGGSKMAAALLKQEGEDNLYGKGVEDSAREVPTGPDPLHHNNIDPTVSP